MAFVPTLTAGSSWPPGTDPLPGFCTSAHERVGRQEGENLT
jgi:hypothetical protein